MTDNQAMQQAATREAWDADFELRVSERWFSGTLHRVEVQEIVYRGSVFGFIVNEGLPAPSFLVVSEVASDTNQGDGWHVVERNVPADDDLIDAAARAAIAASLLRDHAQQDRPNRSLLSNLALIATS